MMNVSIYDNGAGFMVCVNGLQVYSFRTLGAAWNHIAWMHKAASQEFTVGKNETPVAEWIENMILSGALDEDCGMAQ